MSYERLNVDAAAESSWTLKAEFPAMRDADGPYLPLSEKSRAALL